MGKKNGFTLIEISIVFIVIGLIVGGILLSQDLIKSSKYRKIISEHEYFLQAVVKFEEIYNNLPGDIPNASSIWSTAANGNGDGMIGNGLGTDLTGETLASWNHLYRAGLVLESYTGTTYSGSLYFKAGYNVPGSKANEGMYSLYYMTNSVGIYGKKENMIAFARNSTSSNFPWADGILTPKDAQFIDLKIDDGLPSSGRLYILRGDSVWATANACTDIDWMGGVTTANLVITDTNETCRLHFWLK
jgi:prepilin-type N-terminal cleavage/methylation domain-containing protein